MKKIILLCPGNLNVGDNAILFTWLEFFEKTYGRNCEITILGTEVSYISQFVRKFSYKIFVSDMLHRYVWKFYNTEIREEALALQSLSLENTDVSLYEPAIFFLNQIFAEADLLHMVGGGIINNKWKDCHWIWGVAVKLAKKYSAKIVATGQTIGPLDIEDEEFLKEIYENVDYTDLRDSSYIQYLKKYSSKLTVTVDDVLIGALQKSENGQREVLLKTYISRPHVNMCVQQWNMPEDKQELYKKVRKEIAKFVEWYGESNKNIEINFLEFSPTDGDMIYAREIYDMLSDQIKRRVNFISCANFYPGDVKCLINSALLNIGTRFHMALFSMEKFNVPTISIALDDYYEIKLGNIHYLFGSMGYFKLDEITFEILKDWINKHRYYKENFETKMRIKELIDQKVNTYFAVLGKKRNFKLIKFLR